MLPKVRNRDLATGGKQGCESFWGLTIRTEVISLTKIFPSIHCNGALAGDVAALPRHEPARINPTNKIMNKTVSVDGDRGVPGVMADLYLDFVQSPVHRIGFDIDEQGIQLLADRYRDRVFRAQRWSVQEKLTWQTLVLRFAEGVYLVAFGDGRDSGEIIAPTAERALALHVELRDLLRSHASSKGPTFYMLRYDCSEFEANLVDNVPEAVDDDFLRLCYGDDILAWMAKFHQATTERAGGLTIFEGPPGTGKTSLITQLIHGLEETHVFYVLPAAQDNALSSPEFVPFWQRQNTRHADRVKVIVMEDAERLLWRRDGDNRNAVSSLLNIADGLMGRMLRLHIILSVNARMEDLDPAILRPGRLTNHRHFKLLPRATAQQIASKRKTAFRPQPGVGEYTLAEVLNPGPKPETREKRSIGFRTPVAV